MKTYTVKLTLPEINHILNLADDRDRDGWYCGNKEQFEARHERVLEKLNQAIKERA